MSYRTVSVGHLEREGAPRFMDRVCARPVSGRQKDRMLKAPRLSTARALRLCKHAERDWRSSCGRKAGRDTITGDGATIFRHACGLGLEGIVSKRVYFEWYYTPEFSTSLERAWLQRPDYLVAGTRCVNYSAQAKAHTESARHKQSRQIRAAIKRWSLSGRVAAFRM